MAEALPIPMESNPEIMNKFLQKLGVSEKWRMVDVIGLEEDFLDLVPRPVLAVVLLFPISDVYEKHRVEQETEIKTDDKDASTELFHLKQVVSNVCGTIALIHSVANNTHEIELKDGLLKKYLNEAQGLDAPAKGELLENSTDILEAYNDIVKALGDCCEDRGETVDNHFVTFVHKNGTLFELDGRKAFPIDHGATTPDRLLEDAAKICREFIAQNPDTIGFNVVALVQAQ